MPKPFVLLIVFLILFLWLPPLTRAEKIYYTSGKILKASITSRSKGTIWLKRDEGFSTGISTKNISKIENDDGSVSKYDYGALEKKINGCIVKTQYAEAVRLCGIFLEGTPNYVRMRYLRGILNQKIGNLKEAVEDYDFLIFNMAADAKVYNNRGIISVNNKEYDEAIDFFSKAINKDPNMVAAHNNLANILFQRKEYEKAIREYKKVITLEPNNISVWKKILSINPKDKEAKKALGLK